MNNHEHLQTDQKLNPKVLDLGVEQEPIRKGYGEGLLRAGEDHAAVVALCADLTESTHTKAFAERFPERFVEIGVAEQNLVTVASGMAAMGKIPFVTSYAMFSPGRNWEQIRTTICYNDRPVKIVGSHAGVSVGPDGGTHQAIEDIALMQVLPRMTVIAPCDAIEARKATLALVRHEGPAYLRLGREKTPIVTTEDSPFKIGQANVLRRPKDPAVAIFACGTSVYQALLASKILSEEGIEVSVINVHTIKPLDKNTILAEAKAAGAVITVEEHQKIGGLGSSIATLLAENHPVPMEIIGVDDQFGQSGIPGELIEHYGLGAHSIAEKAQHVLARKKKRAGY